MDVIANVPAPHAVRRAYRDLSQIHRQARGNWSTVGDEVIDAVDRFVGELVHWRPDVEAELARRAELVRTLTSDGTEYQLRKRTAWDAWHASEDQLAPG